MDKTTTLSEELLHAWKKGWPEYVVKRQDDFPSILVICRECERIACVTVDEPEGWQRISVAITRIAEYCRDADPWYKKTLFIMSKAIQTILQEMQGDKRAKKLAEEQRRLSDPFYNDQLRVAENKRLMEECRDRAKQWYENNWDDELEKNYQYWKDTGMIIKLGEKYYNGK